MKLQSIESWDGAGLHNAPTSGLLREARRWMQDEETGSYMPSALFLEDDAYEQIMGDEDVESLEPVPRRHLLKRDEERSLFLQYNYCRFRASKLKERGDFSEKTLMEAMRWRTGAQIRRDRLVECNLGLVPMKIQSMTFHTADRDELISAGHMALLCAVKKFDAERGFRFSTYACRAVERSVAHALSSWRRYQQRRPQITHETLVPAIETDFHGDEDSAFQIERLRALIQANEACLTDMELNVLGRRFPGCPTTRRVPGSEPMSRVEIAQTIGVTKERIRQVERRALGKLRQLMESDVASARALC